jgi:transcriptional regulator with XRE-family HTH domain
MNNDFIARLRRSFDDASMAVVARRLGIPHATVRNYYQGRLPAPEVLIKIAGETGVSLNWLLMGAGEMYAGDIGAIDLGKFIENRIAQMIDAKLADAPVLDLGTVDMEPFDVDAAIREFNDPAKVMSRWFKHEGRRYPEDYGVAFFRGWETFSAEDKIAAVRDAKRVLDKVLDQK